VGSLAGLGLQVMPAVGCLFLNEQEGRYEMRNLVLIITLILLWGCATQTTTHKPQTQRVKNLTPEEIYNNYTVNISLNQNKNLFNQLESELITKAKYDSLLSDLGRPGKKYFQVEQLICDTKSDSIYKEIIRAEYFINNDSLLSVVDIKLLNLLKTDSTNASLYVLMGINKHQQKDLSKSIYYLQQAKQHTQPFDNSWLYMVIADIYEDNNQPIMAIKEYEEAFEINNDLLLDKWDNLFDLFVSIGEYGKAEKLFNEVEIISNQTDFRNTHWDELVNLYWKKDELTEAESICMAVRDTSNFKSTTKELILISIKNGDFKSAEDYLWDLSSVEIQSYPFQAKFNFVDFYSWDEHYIEIYNQLKNDINQLSQNQSANFCFGYFLVAKEMNQWNEENKDVSKIREGLAYLKKAKSKESKLNFVIGYLLQSLAENEEAIRYYQQDANNSEFYPYSQINLSVLTKSDDISKSLSYLLAAQKFFENNEEIIEEIGLYYYSYLNDFEKAVEWYTYLMKIEPNSYLESIWLADSYLQLDDIENAQLTISKTIDKIIIDSDSWLRNWYLGMAYETKGDINQKLEKWHQAKRDYENSIKYDPKDMDPRLALADVYYKLEDLPNAEKLYQTVIDSVVSKENVDLDKYYSALRSLNFHYIIFAPDPKKHSILFENAIKIIPEDDWAFRMLGLAYKNQGNYYKATRNLKKAIEINPNSRYNYSELAETYELEGTTDKAIENYKYAIRSIEKENIKIDQENESEDYQSNLESIGGYHSKIADLYKQKEDYDLAILEYQRAISVTPDTTGIIYKFDLADAYFDSKDYNNAIKYWKLVYNKQENFGALFNIGLSYLNIGDPENLKISKITFVELLDKIEGDPDYIDLKNKAENFIEIIDEELNKIEWPEIIEELSNSENGVSSEIAFLYNFIDDYTNINNLFIEANNETTPEKEYLQYSKEWIITGYNVSPKIYQSESLCDRFKAKLSGLKLDNNKILEIKSLWISATETRKEGVKLYSEGYYVKKKEYTGQWERGSAKIKVANQYFADGLVILENLMKENISDFNGNKRGLDFIQGQIDYYSDK